MKTITLIIIFLVLITTSIYAAECMTPSQVASERSKCLYIFDGEVYAKGKYPNKHHAHACGSDVSEVMPQTHISKPEVYLWPYRVSTLCNNDAATEFSQNTTGIVLAKEQTYEAKKQQVSFSYSEQAVFEIVDSKIMWKIGRFTGMLTFILLAISILIGVYRQKLVRWMGIKAVLRLHYIVSYLAFLMVFVHIFSLMQDRLNWGDFLTLSNSFVPSFETPTKINISYGIIALYIMFVGILGCILMRKMIARFGHSTWLYLHRATIVSYVLVYLHAARIGTDFNLVWKILFQVIFIFIIGKYIFDYLNRKGKIKNNSSPD
ncbi:MAG: ferric reductase-like transmembrane domain-containing protein [Candidatus Woesearchaeota archaeon]